MTSLSGMTGAGRKFRDTRFRERLQERQRQARREGLSGGQCTSSAGRLTLTPGHQGPQDATMSSERQTESQ